MIPSPAEGPKRSPIIRVLDRFPRRADVVSLATLACLLGTGLTGGPAAAQSTLDTTTVRSRRIVETREEVPAAVGAVDRSDIQDGRQQLSVDESLFKVPGLFIQNRTNFAQDLRISSRGFGARANFGIRGIKVYVDGIPSTLPDGQTTLDSIDIGSTDRIEVLRGPASSLYGSAAGGVIHITSEEGPAEPFAEARAGGGEFGFQKYQLKVGGQTGALNYLLSGSHLEWDGYRHQSESRSTIANAKLRYDFDETSDLTLTINTVYSPKAEDPGALTAAQVRSDRRAARDRNRLFDAGEALDQQRFGLRFRKRFNDAHRIAARGYVVRRDFDNRLPFLGGGTVEIDRLFGGGGMQHEYQVDLAGHGLRWTSGFDIDAQRDERQRFDNVFGERGTRTFKQDEDVTSYGVYTQGVVEIWEDLELSAGVRFDRVEFDVDDAFLADGDDSGTRSFDEVSPSVALRWKAHPVLHLYGAFSTSFETPTTTEFADPSGGGGLNSDLDAAEALNYEIGAKGLVPGGVQYGVALFWVDVDDELVPFEVPGQPGRSFFRNAGRSTRRGVELDLAVEPYPGLIASAAYTYNHFKYDRYSTPGGEFDHNRIPGVPRNQFGLELAYAHPSGLRAVWDLLYIDEFFANDANTVRNGDAVVSNLRLAHTVELGNFELEPFLGVNNLFDRKYNDNVRLNAFGGRYFEPAPDRNFFGGLRVRYGF